MFCFFEIFVLLNHWNNVTRNQDIGCSDTSISVAVNMWNILELSGGFCLSGGTFLSLPGGQKKLLGCGLLGGGSIPRLILCELTKPLFPFQGHKNHYYIDFELMQPV